MRTFKIGTQKTIHYCCNWCCCLHFAENRKWVDRLLSNGRTISQALLVLCQQCHRVFHCFCLWCLQMEFDFFFASMKHWTVKIVSIFGRQLEFVYVVSFCFFCSLSLTLSLSLIGFRWWNKTHFIACFSCSSKWMRWNANKMNGKNYSLRHFQSGWLTSFICQRIPERANWEQCVAALDMRIIHCIFRLDCVDE